MSPGATFERVYNELKRMLAEGELPPGTPIEPALIGKQIASSITPIRDALHRLTGERLVEAPNHNGFRVPILTEAGLRDVYSWSWQLLALAARHVRVRPNGEIFRSASPDESVVKATARLFIDIAHAAGNVEHLRAVQQLNDRLAFYRRAEGLALPQLDDELNALAHGVRDGDPKRLGTLLGEYHRRRSRAVQAILSFDAVRLR